MSLPVLPAVSTLVKTILYVPSSRIGSPAKKLPTSRSPTSSSVSLSVTVVIDPLIIFVKETSPETTDSERFHPKLFKILLYDDASGTMFVNVGLILSNLKVVSPVMSPSEIRFPAISLAVTDNVKFPFSVL